MWKMGQFEVVMGYSRLLAVSSFDRVHTTYYSSAIETIRLWYTVLEIASYLSKFTNTNLPYLHLASPLGVTPFEFCQDLWHYRAAVFASSYISPF